MDHLEIKRFAQEDIESLLAFLDAIEEEGTARWFSPHPFTRDYLTSLCNVDMLDLHYVAKFGKVVCGYGLLRGWDEGFSIPSLGIAVDRQYRGIGLGKMLMQFLHCAALQRGATKIRLRVSASNATAKSLYDMLGYQFEENEESTPFLLAFKDLRSCA